MRVFWKALRENRRGWIGWTVAPDLGHRDTRCSTLRGVVKSRDILYKTANGGQSITCQFSRNQSWASSQVGTLRPADGSVFLPCGLSVPPNSTKLFGSVWGASCL